MWATSTATALIWHRMAPAPERSHYRQVLLIERLRQAVARLNPNVPVAALDDAVNQFSITGPHHTRRPDIILFVNGLPLVLIELKNPADANADVWKAFQQIQTYKDQIADAFQYNEVLVISDGTDALLGSLSADSERFTASLPLRTPVRPSGDARLEL